MVSNINLHFLHLGVMIVEALRVLVTHVFPRVADTVTHGVAFPLGDLLSFGRRGASCPVYTYHGGAGNNAEENGMLNAW